MRTSEGLRLGRLFIGGPYGPLEVDGQERKLPPKALMILWTLANSAGSVVTKAALMSACWPETAVGEDALSFQIGSLRSALGDTSRNPTYIETVHRLGYRFRAHELTPDSGRPERKVVRTLLERERELAALERCYARACEREPQFVFLGSEAGSGKSALIEHFVDDLRERERIVIGRGRCMDLSVGNETFLPLLDAVSAMCRGSEGAVFVATLARYAPSWLARLPWAAEPQVLRELSQHLAVGPARMLRELADALMAVAAQRPVLLVLEDIHTSDEGAVTDLLALLASRHDAAQLLVVTSFRPSELDRKRDRLQTVRRTLQDRGRTLDLTLAPLSREAIDTYMTARVPRAAAHEHAAAWVHARTGGDPLFVVRLVDKLCTDFECCGGPSFDVAYSLQRSLPPSLRDELGQRLNQLDARELQVLEAGCFAGHTIEPTQLALVLGTSALAVTAVCERLALPGLYLERKWEPGVAFDLPSYGFRCPLLRELVRAQVAPTRAELLARAVRDEPSGILVRSTQPSVPSPDDVRAADTVLLAALARRPQRDRTLTTRRRRTR